MPLLFISYVISLFLFSQIIITIRFSFPFIKFLSKLDVLKNKNKLIFKQLFTVALNILIIFILYNVKSNNLSYFYTNTIYIGMLFAIMGLLKKENSGINFENIYDFVDVNRNYFSNKDLVNKLLSEDFINACNKFKLYDNCHYKAIVSLNKKTSITKDKSESKVVNNKNSNKSKPNLNKSLDLGFLNGKDFLIENALVLISSIHNIEGYKPGYKIEAVTIKDSNNIHLILSSNNIEKYRLYFRLIDFKEESHYFIQLIDKFDSYHIFCELDYNIKIIEDEVSFYPYTNINIIEFNFDNNEQGIILEKIDGRFSVGFDLYKYNSINGYKKIDCNNRLGEGDLYRDKTGNGKVCQIITKSWSGFPVNNYGSTCMATRREYNRYIEEIYSWDYNNDEFIKINSKEYINPLSVVNYFLKDLNNDIDLIDKYILSTSNLYNEIYNKELLFLLNRKYRLVENQLNKDNIKYNKKFKDSRLIHIVSEDNILNIVFEIVKDINNYKIADIAFFYYY